MLFWIIVLVAVLGLLLSYVAKHFHLDYETRNKNKILHWIYYNRNNIRFTLNIIAITASVCVFAFGIAIMANHISMNAKVPTNKIRYEMLCYKLESDKARDEFGFANKEIVDEIQNWNEDVVYYKEIQDNFWVGIFYPNVFDQFKIIELE